MEEQIRRKYLLVMVDKFMKWIETKTGDIG